MATHGCTAAFIAFTPPAVWRHARERNAVATVTVGRAIVDVLRAEGVDHVYGLPGGHVLSIYDALYDEAATG
jgi:hypothetical protein